MFRRGPQNFPYIRPLRICRPDGIIPFRQSHGSVRPKVQNRLRFTTKAVKVARRMIVGIGDKPDSAEPQRNHGASITQAAWVIQTLFASGSGSARISARLPDIQPLMHKVNLAEKFSKTAEYWKPYIAAELNGQCVKLDKIKGEFIFHHHEHEDEMFLVVKGRFRMDYRDKEFRDRHEWIEEGEFIVVPRGVEHRPVADEECWILLFEPASTLNTGNVVNERTHHTLERV